MAFWAKNKFSYYRQLNAMDCGPTCLRMIAKYYGKHFNTERLRRIAGFSKEGVSLLGISNAAQKMGFRTRGVRLTYKQLTEVVNLPCILHWDQNHFVVLPPLSSWKKKSAIIVADPGKGMIRYSKRDFLKNWSSSQNELQEPVGMALLLEPTPAFSDEPGEPEKQISWRLVFQYLTLGKWQIFQVFLALFISSLLQLVFPFLTQSIVDTGISARDIQYITIILIAQLMLVFSRSCVDFIRSRLLLNISAILNLSILSDFWIKLSRLPLSYFDNHQTGDTIQRLEDNKQIQNFLTGPALSTIFSAFNFFIYAIVLAIYSYKIFLVFATGSLLYFIWIRFFLNIRRKLNYQTFSISARENSATLQLVQGMQEIRINNAEQSKRWEWENIQVSIFKLHFKGLTYSQLQQAGALLINQGKDVIITFLVANLVVRGQLTLGTMLAVQYIIGQLSGPIEQFIGFVQSAQDAKISMERLNEIHQLADEEDPGQTLLNYLPEEKSIHIHDLTFSYPGSKNEPVLQNINLSIPEGKVTAIVGVSGSGKTTLLKLLLKFYELDNGEIKVGDTNFKYISPSFWRRNCGAVLQDGYIFDDDIAGNIAVGGEPVDDRKLIKSCKMANILSFVESLPNGFYTKLGSEGINVSQGQKQRILIARAIYKDPQYLFFDEATNALDANNEKMIVENLQDFFKDRTVVVVAHRLSTVKNADKIIVIHEGRISEQGSHRYLSDKKGRYFELVRNQLELGS